MSICLRPHHGMCFQFYEGKGYSEDFTDHMGRVIRACEEKSDQLITLTCSTDVVCRNCPNNEGGICTTEDKVQRYDSDVLKACGLDAGAEIPYEDFLKLVKMSVIDIGKRKEICGDCSWDYICSKNG